jgi:ParB-like chromosome segregation protein Spo0J
MFALIVTATLPWTFSCQAPLAGERARAGPSLRRPEMAIDKEGPPNQGRATTRPTTVPLNEFVLKPELFCHRDPAELTDRARLKPLMDSIQAHGLLSPVEFFRGPAGEPLLDEGHRRISGCRFLAQDDVPGFTATMPIASIEVIGASEQQILIRSVAENVFRRALSLVERIRAAKTLKEGGVKLEDIAAALDIGVKQLGRDLRIANAPWMLAHLGKDDIGHTAAADLLEAAAAVDRVGDVQDHIAVWIAERRKVVGESKKLKALLTKVLSDHWIALLKEKQPLDDNVAQTASFQATIDADANSVTVEGTILLMTQPLDELKLARANLVAAQRVVEKYLEARSAIEGSQGPQDVAREEAKHLGLLINPFGLPLEASGEAPATETNEGK